MTFVEKKKNVKMPGPGMKATAGMGNLLGVCVYLFSLTFTKYYSNVMKLFLLLQQENLWILSSWVDYF